MDGEGGGLTHISAQIEHLLKFVPPAQRKVLKLRRTM